ncbi:Transposase IS4 [Popillia japonica]|uniref:Transposase IS4 n=1 Tax=Popillia japonica TaxID=7064 RepID=A0AAW1JCD8_POPJA
MILSGYHTLPQADLYWSTEEDKGLKGYHTLPQADLYWSTEEDKGLKILRDCVARNRFRDIKRNIHLSDNSKLDIKDKYTKLRPFFDLLNKKFMQFGVFSTYLSIDKYTKLRPFFDLLNKKFMQFGVFSTYLSIDEQLVLYFGRHSCKMFLKEKPVRFGFKLFVYR